MKSANQLLKEYEKNKDEIENINLRFKIFHKKMERGKEKLSAKFDKKISNMRLKLEAVQEKELQKNKKMNEKIERKEIAKKRIISKINEKISEFERTIAFLKMDANGDLTINDSDVSFMCGIINSYYKERYFKWVKGYFFDDKFLKIRLLVCENRNPVNGFSVVAVGKTSFEKYLSRLYCYGTDLNTGNNLQLLILVKTFPSVEKAEKWLKRKKSYIRHLTNIICEYKKFKKEYLKIIKKYRDNDNLMELIEAKEMAEKL